MSIGTESEVKAPQPMCVAVPDDLRSWYKKYAKGFRFKSWLQTHSGIDHRVSDKILAGEMIAPESLEKLEALKIKIETA